MNRPFYTTFAWAYDLIIQGPVQNRVDFIVSQLSLQNITNSAHVLDAGCGTGSYTFALAERGFKVTGVDISSDLIAEAERKCYSNKAQVNFIVSDILNLPESINVDAILCRGVLNDLTEEESRRAAFTSFTGAIHEGGILILDVREWNSTVNRKKENPVFEKIIETEKGELAFRSVTRFQPETHSLLISETHDLKSPMGRETVVFDFEMKCWTQGELTDHLETAGFDIIQYFGDYDTKKPVDATDRIIAVAILAKTK